MRRRVRRGPEASVDHPPVVERHGHHGLGPQVRVRDAARLDHDDAGGAVDPARVAERERHEAGPDELEVRLPHRLAQLGRDRRHRSSAGVMGTATRRVGDAVHGLMRSTLVARAARRARWHQGSRPRRPPLVGISAGQPPASARTIAAAPDSIGSPWPTSSVSKGRAPSFAIDAIAASASSVNWPPGGVGAPSVSGARRPRRARRPPRRTRRRARRMAGGGHDPQAEHGVAVGDRGQRPRHGDRRDVLGARVGHRVRRPLEHGRGAARVVLVLVREDDVTDVAPAEPGGFERVPDRVLAARHARVHDRGLAVPGQDVRGDEPEVDAPPGRGAGGRRSRAGRRCGAGRRARRRGSRA